MKRGLILLLILIVIALALSWNNLTGNVIKTCTDTDQGVNQYIQGKTTSITGDIYKDYCSDETILVEYYCGLKEIAESKKITCEFGCENGACEETQSIIYKAEDPESSLIEKPATTEEEEKDDEETKEVKKVKEPDTNTFETDEETYWEIEKNFEIYTTLKPKGKEPLITEETFFSRILDFFRGTFEEAEESVVILENESLTVQYGHLPIILIAPHGGEKQPPGVLDRSCDEDNFEDDCHRYNSSTGEILRVGDCCRGGSCSTVPKDGRTKELTLFLAEAIKEQFGRAPYYVIADTKRQYIDFNRDAKSFDTSFHRSHPDVNPESAFYCAYDQPAGEYYWEAYHNKVEELIDLIDLRFGAENALLIDVHGIGLQRFLNDLVLGMGLYTNSTGDTQVGRTLPHMRTHDENLPFLFNSSDGFVARLGEHLTNDHGFRIDIVPEDKGEIDYKLIGGYDVMRYARAYNGNVSWGGPQNNATRPMIDSIQLEYGSYLRKCLNDDGAWRFCNESVEISAIATAKALKDSWELLE